MSLEYPSSVAPGLTAAEARAVYLAQQIGYGLAENARLAALRHEDAENAIRSLDGLYELAFQNLPKRTTSGLEEFYRLLGLARK